METPSKFQFKFNNELFILPYKYIHTRGEGKSKETVIYLNVVAVASIIKQYVKKKYPNVIVSSWSETFSMGNAVNVHISTIYGEKVDKKIYDDIYKFSNNFKSGTFNGMTDSYEYSKNNIKSEKGTKIDYNVKFLTIYNEPKFGTVQSVVNMLTEGESIGEKTLNETITRIKRYVSNEKTLEKALGLYFKYINLSK